MLQILSIFEYSCRRYGFSLELKNMLDKRIFNIESTQNFEMLALEVFQYQYTHEATYRNYCELLRINPKSVQNVSDIPFLPIEFFKQRVILSSEKKAAISFRSSGTTESVSSHHHIADLGLYLQSFLTAFTHFYGEPHEYTILALLPSYLEQGESSLVYMVDQLISESKSPHSGFFLNDRDALVEKLRFLEDQDKKVLLLGVSYALLDLIEKQSFRLKNTIIMETGGMKGRRKELIKKELHRRLKQGFGVSTIHSEYGMTELLSQAYSHGNGIFKCPPWMKVYTRDPEDPLTLISEKTGGLNVIDLANLYSCSFIATQDLAKIHPDQSFEILGRFDTSDIRGCNLMVL